MWEHPLKLHAKTTPFYIMDLITHGFWFLRVQGYQTQSPKGTMDRGQGFLGTSAAPPALDTVSSTATQLLTCLGPQFLCQASLMMIDIGLLYFCF
ncbi:hypothetical protein K5549_022028 [Capra hircus]|uniref:Uncharacterized protein n=1 Tax=Capra hircus TaxID=9925 RepID=A0A452EZ45_CAPHI|nr:hypothetical protein K5549_022028 [Capra hircus]